MLVWVTVGLLFLGGCVHFDAFLLYVFWCVCCCRAVRFCVLIWFAEIEVCLKQGLLYVSNTLVLWILCGDLDRFGVG